MRSDAAVAAVDWGAGSIRVCRVDVETWALEVVHRYEHQPVRDAGGHLRWDWDRLVAETVVGLEAAGPVASIGVDTWGVDYGLLDGDGRLVAPPFSYRDHRTDGYREVVDRLGEQELYATTGIQLQPFNTLFQLAAHDRDELARARHVVLLPELVVHHLTGEVHAERTSAGTTALVDVATGTWSPALLDAAGVGPALLSPIEPATTPAGTWRGIPVHLVGGHDTASAVAAIDAAPSTAFVSAGTWLLVGRLLPAAVTDDEARAANFTNEAGATGGVRFLKNLAGSWLVEGCRPAWDDPPVADLLAAAAAVEHDGRILDVTDPRFLHPADMLGEVTDALGLPRATAPPVVARAIVESLVAGTAATLDQLARRGPFTEVHVFGGGGQSSLYRRRLHEVTGLPVVAGPTEATALGNARVQALALGVAP